MREVHEYPPMFDEIDARFHVRGQRVIYAWGDIIYNPMRIVIPPQLVVHERVHGMRQGRLGVEEWWKRYIDSEEFRLQEEIPAHIAEYQHLAKRAPNRQQRRAALRKTAKRLAGPLYGNLITSDRAAKVLRDADRSLRTV